MGEFLSAEEVAEILGLKIQTLALWRCYKKELPFFHVGRLVRYKRQDVEAWLARRRVEVSP